MNFDFEISIVDLFLSNVNHVLVPKDDNQGPVVQSIVSLTSSLRGQLVKCFTTL